MVKLGCSFSGKPGKDPGDQDGATTDSVPLISPLDVSQLQPPFPDQVRSLGQHEGPFSACPGNRGVGGGLLGRGLLQGAGGQVEEGLGQPEAQSAASNPRALGSSLLICKPG